MYRSYCQKKSLCPECDMTKRCCTCKKEDCRQFCPNYRSEMCPNTCRAPYVCNGCQSTYDCRKPHFFYRANVAYSTYRALLKDSREGIALSRQQLYELDCLLTPLIKRGQPIAHIYATHENEIPCSLRSLYNYIDQGVFTVRNIDLPKKVKYKPRKSKRKRPVIDYAYREGRTYKDFQSFIQNSTEINVVEMDTVHGSNKTGNVMLTMLFRNCNLMIITLMPECTQKCVKNALDNLEQKMGAESFARTFPVILTDNGPEFKGAEDLEKSIFSRTRTRLFYCDPLASWQKAKLEKNHVYIRKVIPKGVKFVSLNQEHMTLLSNHINSAVRASLNGRTPFELASLLLDNKLIQTADLMEIPADKIILNKSLFKH